MRKELIEAKERGEVGAARAADKAERIDEGWIHQSIDALVKFYQGNPGEHTIEQAREFCPPLPEGADARAWGYITRHVLNLGLIEKTGRFAPASSSNGSPKPLYRYAGY